MLDDSECTVFADAPGDVAADRTHVRFVHASPDAPAVDVRVADGGPTLCETIEFRDAGADVPVVAGSSDREAVPTGSDDVASSLPDAELGGGAAVSAIAVGQAGDGSPGAAFANDTRWLPALGLRTAPVAGVGFSVPFAPVR